MKHIFGRYAYSAGPRDGCWWDETIAAPVWPEARGDLTADVAIIGGGYTGLSAALHLAEAGIDVALVEAEYPGWGASGRNGGFCCVGGAKLSSEKIAKAYGADQAAEFHHAEIAAIDLVADILKRFDIDADTHSHGETQLAHSPRAMERLRQQAKGDPDAILHGRQDLADQGMQASGLTGPFQGGLTVRHGFGLNPRKYVLGLARAAAGAGARIYQNSPAGRITRQGGRNVIALPHGSLSAETVLICTNGYSSDDLPDWLAGRYIPAQSTALVTRPLTEEELAAQGWTSDQMAYDTRHLLHYFRLMPDRRFLFGMRGGLTSTPGSETGSRARVRRDFETMFPAWAHVESRHSWSGMVCVSRNQIPFTGPVPGMPGVFAGLAYHGNGVAMGSYAGSLLAALAQGHRPDSPYPGFMGRPMGRFPFGRFRRIVMPPAYLAFRVKDL
ncbi:NAD(P)/FAD-dependent oxidoreductase [Pseudodonghicola flavimaris]|uniref:FAD-binding oxidoreductase n=1 Tax=Pseudodonghicola flavimaris TaxID=3050036 RepID=A0ABT7EX42_9RHOB|nr:FAD-binding oxidoreductase [Pseudodonghicola flavimaris]MDK3016913.1 FAD-binding oxidoreductase [Pseudodonghicola flavimaris]